MKQSNISLKLTGYQTGYPMSQTALTHGTPGGKARTAHFSESYYLTTETLTPIWLFPLFHTNNSSNYAVLSQPCCFNEQLCCSSSLSCSGDNSLEQVWEEAGQWHHGHSMLHFCCHWDISGAAWWHSSLHYYVCTAKHRLSSNKL